VKGLLLRLSFLLLFTGGVILGTKALHISLPLFLPRFPSPLVTSSPMGPPDQSLGVLIVYFDPGIEIERAEAVLNAAVKTQARWVRIGFIWPLANPEPGVFHLAPFDDLINLALARGLRVLPVVMFTPTWASARPNAPDPYAYPPSPEPLPNGSGTGYDALETFAVHIAAHYQGRVTYWEFWNEPDMQASLHDLDGNGTSADEYVNMLEAFARGIRRGNPRAKVVLGGLAQAGTEAGGTPGYLESLLRVWRDSPRAAPCDVINFHTNFLAPDEIMERIAANRALTARFGLGALPFWITESSYPSDPAHQILPSYQGGPAAQARYVSDALGVQLRAGVQVVFWATLHDDLPDTPESDPYKYAGLFSYDLQPKPAVQAFRRWAAVLKPSSP